MCFLVPNRVELEEACTLGVGWVSATQVLQQRLFKDVDERSKGVEENDAVSEISCLFHFQGEGDGAMLRLMSKSISRKVARR